MNAPFGNQALSLAEAIAGPSVEAQPPVPPAGPKPYAKGQRSSSACDACHARKTRCSGDNPCKFCSSRDIPCIVSDSATRTASTSAKRPRMSSTTSSNAAPGSSKKSKQQSTPPATQGQPSTLQVGRSVPLLSPNNRNSVPLANPSQIPSGFSPPPSLNRSPNHLQSYQQLPSRQASNLSPPVATTTNNNNATIPPSSTAPQDSEHSVSGTILTRYQRPPTIILEPRIPQLIDRRSAEKYFDAYFTQAEWLYQLYPIPQYISAYHEAIWTAEDGSVPAALITAPIGISSILAAVLALGALFERKVEDSERLYRAARQSYHDITDLATLESIQLALQLAVFEINTSRSKAVWSSLAVAVRLSHYLNLHRKPALAGKGPEEMLRRCQLWYNCFVHDCWLSLSSGRPALAVDGDSDLDSPWIAPAIGELQLVSSPIFGMRVRLSAIWTTVHDQLYRRRNETEQDVPWLERLPRLENDFQAWARDMDSLSTTLAVSRSDKKQVQAILLAQAIMRLIMHRSFLIQRAQLAGQQAIDRQQQVSEAAVLDGALTVITTCKRLIQLGIHLSFWFLTVDLQIACLALCEYLQNQHEKSTGMDISRPEEGLRTATGLLQEIADSGENAAVGQTLDAVKAIQAAWEYQRTQASLQVQAQGQSQINSQTNGHTLQPQQQQQTASSALGNPFPLETPSSYVNGAAEFDSIGALLSDFDWFSNFGAGNNIFDAFVASPAPAAENLAWWIAPRGSDMQ